MSTDRQSTRLAEVSTPSDREIHIERVFDAPRDRVFAAYTDPEQVAQWWGQRGTTTVVEEMDVRPGGTWRFLSRDADGNEIRFSGVYREVSPPERLSQTFEWDGMPGYVSAETATFEDLGEQTRVVTDVVFHTAEERDGMLDAGMEKGMNESLQRLDELLAAA